MGNVPWNKKKYLKFFFEKQRLETNIYIVKKKGQLVHGFVSRLIRYFLWMGRATGGGGHGDGGGCGGSAGGYEGGEGGGVWWNLWR